MPRTSAHVSYSQVQGQPARDGPVVLEISFEILHPPAISTPTPLCDSTHDSGCFRILRDAAQIHVSQSIAGRVGAGAVKRVCPLARIPAVISVTVPIEE